MGIRQQKAAGGMDHEDWVSGACVNLKGCSNFASVARERGVATANRLVQVVRSKANTNGD